MRQNIGQIGQRKTLTLGSLFDGSGGFPLGGTYAGVTPLWASGIEPFAIRVTTKRLPFMKHYGDISNLDGAKLPPVDIITFGSPCQDMSVAGPRTGLKGSRSNLFYEAIRIIKEMRCATDGKYPRYIVWENVRGAFSSNKGEDFRCVLESVCRIADKAVYVPSPKKWQDAGSIVGDGYSVAWRVLDAQHWGVPQRRKRIFLVADFTGQCAEKILFESEGLSGYTPKDFYLWQEVASDTGAVFENHWQDSRHNGPLKIAPTLTRRLGTGGNNVPLVVNHDAVRRLTPTECARLQGFPDWWCDDLGTDNPTGEEVIFWREVFEKHRKITGTSTKPKTDAQIIKWLKAPHSDSAEYRLWGNGVALPCVCFVLFGIAYYGDYSKTKPN